MEKSKKLSKKFTLHELAMETKNVKQKEVVPKGKARIQRELMYS